MTATDASTTTRRKRRANEGHRAVLVEAAVRVIAREGVNAATTRKIADEAGLPQSVLNYWFAGKAELLEEVVGSVIDRLVAAMEGVRETRTAPPTDLLDVLRAAWQVVEQDDPGAQLALYELTAMALRTPGMSQLARRQYQLYRQTALLLATDWCAATGVQLPGGTETLARLIASTFDGMTLSWLADPDGAEPDQVFQLLAHLLDCSVPAHA